VKFRDLRVNFGARPNSPALADVPSIPSILPLGVGQEGTEKSKERCRFRKFEARPSDFASSSIRRWITAMECDPTRRATAPGVSPASDAVKEHAVMPSRTVASSTGRSVEAAGDAVQLRDDFV
jgi:hypothetical protein